MAQVKDALVIGRTENTEMLLDAANPHGIITPRTENFTIDGAKFFNYNWSGRYGVKAAAIGDCSHCFHSAATDSGGRQVTVKNIVMDTTVTKRIRYQFPYHGIWKDEDGGLTGLIGKNTWAVAYKRFNDWAGECYKDLDVYEGHVCENTVQVRRVAFSEIDPSPDFKLQYLKVL